MNFQIISINFLLECIEHISFIKMSSKKSTWKIYKQKKYFEIIQQHKNKNIVTGKQILISRYILLLHNCMANISSNTRTCQLAFTIIVTFIPDETAAMFKYDLVTHYENLKWPLHIRTQTLLKLFSLGLPPNFAPNIKRISAIYLTPIPPETRKKLLVFWWF